jgi:hypothetical protein
MAPPPIDVLKLRAWARARLWRIGEFDLHEAIDALQAAAAEYGLVESIGQDAVQEILSAAFAQVREDLIEVVELKASTRAQPEPPTDSLIAREDPDAAPHSTVEALMWCLREQGLACLLKTRNRKRLSRCDAAAMAQIAQRLIAMQWDPNDVEKLILARRVVGA